MICWHAVTGWADSIESDLEGALCNLNSNLNLTIDQLAPLKSINIKKKFAPWLGPELRQLIDKRDATHRRTSGGCSTGW